MESATILLLVAAIALCVIASSIQHWAGRNEGSIALWMLATIMTASATISLLILVFK